MHHMSVNAHKLSLWWSLFVSDISERFWKLGKLRDLLDQCLAWRFVLVTCHHEVSFTFGGHSSISQHCTDVNSYFLGWFHVEGHVDAEFPASLTSCMSCLWHNLTSAAVFETEEVSWYTDWWCMAYTVQYIYHGFMLHTRDWLSISISARGGNIQLIVSWTILSRLKPFA